MLLGQLIIFLSTFSRNFYVFLLGHSIMLGGGEGANVVLSKFFS